MFGAVSSQRMRGRNADGVAAAQKRRVLLIACSMVLMLSLLSIYHGSFFRYHRLHNKNKLIREERFSDDDNAGRGRGSSSSSSSSDWSVSSSKALEITAVEEEQEEEENDHPLTAKLHDNTGKLLDPRVTAEEEEAAATTGNNEQSDGQDDSEDKNDSNDSDENDKEIEDTRDERSSVEESESSADDSSSSSDDEGTDDLPLKSIPVCSDTILSFSKEINQ